MRPIYLDYNATTPVDPRVATVISDAVAQLWGNPSSTHVYGNAAQAALERAREQVALLIGAEPHEIVFTGGGSEASNLAIKGTCLTRPRGFLARLLGSPGAHVITSAVEHPATHRPLEFLRTLGTKITTLPVDGRGQVDPDDVRRAIRAHTRLVTIMHSNNEVGTLMPIREIGRVCRDRGVLFHTDCAQSIGKVPVNVRDLQVDMLTIAGHKLYAPKGVGALYVRHGVELEPLIHGAGHEAGRRAGTENTPYLVGLGQAAELCRYALPGAAHQLQALRDRLYLQLVAALGKKISLNGHEQQRLPNTININFHGWSGAELLRRMPGIAASTGAACHEKGKERQSPILCAMKVDPEIGIGAVRLSVGRFTNEDEIDRAAAILIAAARSRP